MKLATAILSILAISSCSVATEAARTRTKDLENGTAKTSSSRYLRQEKKKGEETTIENGTNTPPTGPANRIVTFNSKEERAAFLEANPDLTIHKIFKRGTSIVITLTQEEAVAMLEIEAVKAIEFDDIIELEPINPEPAETPKGTASTQSETTPYGIDMVKALEVDDSNISAMTLCIADTGYDLGHEDLQTDHVTGESFVNENWYEDGDGHKTHVAGTIAALQNDKGVRGVVRNGNMNLLIAQVCNSQGCPLSAVMEGFEWCADTGANVISASLAGGGYIQAFADLTKEIYEEDNVLIVASSGNTRSGAMYPAFYDSVMSVAAVDSTKALASFSTQNSGVEIAAPGVGVLSTIPRSYGVLYAGASGTSMACPHVSGIAALIWSHFPSKSARDIRQALRASAEDLGDSGRDYSFGYGLVNAEAAFNWLEAGNTLSPTSSPTQCNGNTLRVESTTDFYPSEIEWNVTNVFTDEVILESSYPWVDKYGTFIYEACIPTCSEDDLYMFQVFDYYIDGGLEYTIKIDDIEIISSGPYTYFGTEITYFSSCGKLIQLIPTGNPSKSLTPMFNEDTDVGRRDLKNKKATRKLAKATKTPKATKTSKSDITVTLADNEYIWDQIWYYTPESYLMNAALNLCLQGGKGGSLFLSDCDFDKFKPSQSFLVADFYNAVVSTTGRKPLAISLADDDSLMLKEFLHPDAKGEPLELEIFDEMFTQSFDVANEDQKKKE